MPLWLRPARHAPVVVVVPDVQVACRRDRLGASPAGERRACVKLSNVRASACVVLGVVASLLPCAACLVVCALVCGAASAGPCSDDWAAGLEADLDSHVLDVRSIGWLTISPPAKGFA